MEGVVEFKESDGWMPLDRLRDLYQADSEGRIIILPVRQSEVLEQASQAKAALESRGKEDFAAWVGACVIGALQGEVVQKTSQLESMQAVIEKAAKTLKELEEGSRYAKYPTDIDLLLRLCEG